jgi:hypothetical protein
MAAYQLAFVTPGSGPLVGLGLQVPHHERWCSVFLVEDHWQGGRNLVFTWEDPRADGYTGNVLDDVRLNYDMEAVHDRTQSQSRPEAAVGRDADNPTAYRVFRYSGDRDTAGYQPVTGKAVVFGTWADYLHIRGG